MLFRRLILPVLLAICATLLAPTPGFSADWDRFPDLKPRAHIAIKKRFDGPKYRDLRKCYRRFDSRAGADYFGAMVDITSETGSRSRKENDATPYANALYEAWASDKILDNKDDILVVFGLRNRSIAIRPGAKWKKIGFDAATIANTIEASHFEKNRRRRRYSDALCSLITAVDLRLVSLQQKMDERVGALEQRLPEIDSKLSALHKKVAARFEALPNKEHPFGQKLLAQLAAARTQLDEAKKLAPDDPKEAVLLADKAEAALAPVRNDLAMFNKDMERLDTVEADVASLKTTIFERDDVDAKHPKLALLQVAKCEELAKKIRNDYHDKPWQVRDCQRRAELQLARADVHHYYLRSLLPKLAIALLILLCVSFLILRTLRRRRAMAQLKPDLTEWQNRLASAAALRDELALKAPSYFAPGRAPWLGESAEIDRVLRESSARITALLAQGGELLKKAQALHKKSHFLNASRLEKALAILRKTPLREGAQTTGDATASQLLGRLDAAQIDAIGALEDVRAVQTRLDEQATRAAQAATRAERGLEQRRALGLPVEHLSAPLRSAIDAWQSGIALSEQNPAKAADTFEQQAVELGEIADRADLGNQVVERIRGELSERAENLGQRIKQLRFAGIDLKKLSFDPNLDLNAAEREATRIVDAVSRAQEDAAHHALNLLDANLEQLARRLDSVDQADEKIPRRIEQLAARSEALKQQLMDFRYALKSLANHNNPEVYKASSEQVGRYQSQLNQLGKVLNNAQKDYRLKRFLSATQKLDAAARLVERAEALLDELGNLETTVAQAQTQCEQLLGACKSQAEQLQSKAKNPALDADLRALISQQLDAYQSLNNQAANEQANWLDARDELDALQKSMAFLNAQAGADLKAFDQARELLQKLHSDFAAAQSAPLTPEFAESIAQTNKLIHGWSLQIQDANAGGSALLRAGKAAAKSCARACEIADAQPPIAEAAHRQLTRANARYAQVHNASYGYDVVADCTQAGSDLTAAANQIELGNFAQALATAEAATAQIDLEDARAHALALRKYRRTQTHHLSAITTAPNLVAFGPRRRQSGGHAALSESSETGV